MEDLNDIYFFASVVQYGGFSAAARKIGVEKTRLSRRIAALKSATLCMVRNCSERPQVRAFRAWITQEMAAIDWTVTGQ